MLSLSVVATTDGATSLHSPVLVFGVTALVVDVAAEFVAVGEEHEVATTARTACRANAPNEKAGSHGRTLHTRNRNVRIGARGNVGSMGFPARRAACRRCRWLEGGYVARNVHGRVI